MQNLYHSDSVVDESMTGSQHHSRQFNQEAQEPKFISNRQKILNLHERIKKLDQLGSGNKEQKVNLQFLSKNSKKQVKFDDQSPNQEDLRKVVSEKTFLRKPSAVKPIETEANIQKPQQTSKQIRQSVQSPTHNQKTSMVSLNQLTPSPLQNNQSFINHSKSSNHQQSQSGSKLPFNQSPKNQGYESQNVSSAYYRPANTSELFPLEIKYLSIEDKFLQFKMSEENLLANIDGEIRELQQSCKHLKKQFEKVEKRNQETLDSIEKSLAAQIVDLSAQLKEVKRGAMDALDNKQKAIRCETIAMITQSFESQCKLASTEIQSQLETTQRALQKEENLRDETAQFLITSFGDEIIKLEEALNAQKEMRIRKNDELLKLIISVENHLIEKVEKEKREMTENIDAMENMLEQVCYKIEEKILGM